MLIILTLYSLVIWTPAGLVPEVEMWSTLPCEEVVIMAERTLALNGGGHYELQCEEFAPIHEYDLNPYFMFDIHPSDRVHLYHEKEIPPY